MKLKLEIEDGPVRPFVKARCGCGKWKSASTVREDLLAAWAEHCQLVHGVRGVDLVEDK